MTARTRAQLNSDADTALADNAGGDISAADIRQRVKDLADSALFAEDIDTNTALGTSDTKVPSQKAVKTYVDGLAVNLGKRGRVRAATTANITISTALNNGDTLDGVTLATGDLVLVKNQSTASQNGVYVVGASPARASEYDSWAEFPGSLLGVAEGTTNDNTLWLCTSNDGGTLDSTSITFSQLRVAGELLVTDIGSTIQGHDNTLDEVAALAIVAGDLIYGDGSDSLARLAKGSNGQILKLASGLPSWADEAAGGSGGGVTTVRFCYDSTSPTTLKNGDVIDGVTIATGDKFLCGAPDGSSSTPWGIYVVGASNSARDTAFDTWAELQGCVVKILEGTTYANILATSIMAATGTLGTTLFKFVRFFEVAHNPKIASIEALSLSQGDLLYANSGGGSFQRLGVGSVIQFLRGGSNPSWSEVSPLQSLGSVNTTSGTTQTITMGTGYELIILEVVGVSAGSSGNLTVALSDDGSTFDTAIAVSAAATNTTDLFDGIVIISNTKQTGRKEIIGMVGKNGAFTAIASGAQASETGPTSAIRVGFSSTFDAGVIRAWGLGSN